MKAKYFLIGVILLTFGAFCATVNTRAADYSIGVSENTEITWEVTIIDEEGLEDLFEQVDLDEGGHSWRYWLNLGTNQDEVGARWKIKVDWINESDVYLIEDKEEGEWIETDVWIVFYDSWDPIDPDNDFNPEPDDNEKDAEVEQDPDDINLQTYNDDPDIEDSGAFVGDLPFFVPTPVENYLDEIKWRDDDWIPYLYGFYLTSDSELDEDDLRYEYSVDGTTLIHECCFVWDDTPEDPVGDGDIEIEDYIRKWTIDESTGIKSLYQIINDDDEVLYEWSTISAIPGYELPILLGITATFVIGLIYIIRKGS